MKIHANVYWEGNPYPTHMRIEFDNSEVEGMSDGEKQEHIQEMIKEQILHQLHIDWVIEKDAVLLTT